MLANNSDNIQTGQLEPDIHLPATAKVELMEFIAQQLPSWRDQNDRPAEDAETVLTSQLCAYLNSACYDSEAWSHVQFLPETRDETKKNRNIDMTAHPRASVLFIKGRRHSQFDPLFPIECKRLPIPADRDEREYVTSEPSTGGGIQRFKFGHHGASHDFAGMIGYIQENDPDFWLEKVNGWLLGLSQEGSEWSSSDFLEPTGKDSVGRCCRYKSHHVRSGRLNDIVLHHVWISMN
jgi:hypothetical protein